MRPHLDWLGVSIDASTDDIHGEIGRAPPRAARAKESHLDHVRSMWREAKRLGYGLKLNTVVSRPTLGDDMSQLVIELRPDRWKVFQVLKIEGENDEHFDDMSVSSKEFEHWLTSHRSKVRPHNITLVAEGNEDMRGTYAMMDWDGKLYTNVNGSYRRSRSSLDIGVEAAWNEVSSGFSHDKFRGRGGVWEW